MKRKTEKKRWKKLLDDIRGKLSAIFLLDPMDIIDLVGITAIMGHKMSFSAFPENLLNSAMRDIGDDIVCRLLLTIILIQIDVTLGFPGKPNKTCNRICKLILSQILKNKFLVPLTVIVLILDFIIGTIITHSNVMGNDFLLGEKESSEINPHLIYYIFLTIASIRFGF